MKPLNFQKYDDKDLVQEYNEINNRQIRKITLDRIEEICAYYGNPSSEKDVSTMYDNFVEECGIDITDKPMLRGGFADYVDGIEKDGQIHRLQSYSYDYTGKLSMD